jgi:hypothetical protein
MEKSLATNQPKYLENIEKIIDYIWWTFIYINQYLIYFNYLMNAKKFL